MKKPTKRVILFAVLGALLAIERDAEAACMSSAADGSFGWTQGFGSTSDPGDELGYAIEIDGFGAFIVGGRFYGTMDVGSTTLTASGSADGFTAKVTP